MHSRQLYASATYADLVCGTAYMATLHSTSSNSSRCSLASAAAPLLQTCVTFFGVLLGSSLPMLPLQVMHLMSCCLFIINGLSKTKQEFLADNDLLQPNGEPVNAGLQYIIALYWAAMTVSTIGKRRISQVVKGSNDFCAATKQRIKFFRVICFTQQSRSSNDSPDSCVSISC